MNSCNKCLYNNDDICQNDKCSFDSEDNCYEFEDIFTYNKGYHQGRIDLLTEFKEQGAYDIVKAEAKAEVINTINKNIDSWWGNCSKSDNDENWYASLKMLLKELEE